MVLLWPFLLLCSIFYAIYYVYILKIPPVWPDDAFIADVSLNLLEKNIFGSNLVKGNVPGAEFFGFGYPPLFFYMIAAWFKLFGFSITNQRIFSLVVGILFAFTYVQVLRLFIKSKKEVVDFRFVLIGLTLLFLDDSFQKATIISRPEIVVLLLGFLSVFIYFKNYKHSYIFSGFILGLAFISHYLAIIFFLSFMVLFVYEFRYRIFSTRKVYYFLISFLAPIICWIISINQYLWYLINIFALRLQYRVTSPKWVVSVFLSESIELKLIYGLYIIVGIILFIKTLRFPNVKNIFVSSLLLFSWIFSYIWQTEYSFVFVPVFSLFALSYILFSQIHNYNFKKLTKDNILILLTCILFSAILVLNTYQFASKIVQLGGDNFSYKQFDESITALIPDNVTVYTSAIPDPYYSLIKKKGITIYEFPAFFTSMENVISILNSSDYIIFNSPLEISSLGKIISIPYIQKNAERIWQIGHYGQYQALVVKLVPHDKRLVVDK